MADFGEQNGVTRNGISGGVFYSAVVQGGHVTLNLPEKLAPALTGLPAAAATFTGREAVLRTLTEALRPDGTAPDGHRVHAIAGLPGVGKTELVLQAAHHALGQDGWFDGGVLFIDLFGYDPERRLTPERALGDLLRALGIPDEHVPAELQDRARLYRSVLATYADQGRPVLLVLDNARTAGQVAPLLPADRRVPALVTSRHTLAGLEARLHDLSVLEEAEAVLLLSEVLGKAVGPDERRVASAPGDAAELAVLCGFLPLALRIAAALLADLPQRPLSSLAGALKDTRQRLGRLSREDLAVRAAFALSYAHLDAEQARLFRLLPLNPGPDVSTESAARLSDIDAYRTEELLQDLARCHLIEPGAVYGRWRMHDLIRLYADERGGAQDGPEERSGAVARLLNHYVGTAWDAGSHFAAGISSVQPRDGFATQDEARAWLDAERPNLVAAASSALALGRPSVPQDLLIRLYGYLSLDRHFADWITLGTAALACARATASPASEARALGMLTDPLRELRRFEEARTALEQVVAHHRAAGDRPNEGGALVDLGLVMSELRMFDRATDTLNQAIALLREAGDRRGEGAALTNLGMICLNLRRFDEAVALFTRDIDICVELGDRHGEAHTLGNLGATLHKADRPEEAVEALTRARAAYRETGDAHGEAQAMNNLGLVLRRAGRFDESAEAHTGAIETFRRTQAPHSEGLALNNLGITLIAAERFAEAVGPLERAVERFRDTADLHGEAMALVNLATALLFLARTDEAITTASHAADRYGATGDRHDEALARCVLAEALAAAGRGAEALPLLTAAIPVLRETNDAHYADAAQEARDLLAQQLQS
ncbi:tetratricopeptide repeat protein [Streptomyces sp. NPDC059564]|uniref:tetratricopeptide repeat protein n=1 Tax=Streptomyces sp. NPDC059564 TaxID=3346865 RepID=UPI0036A4ABE6